MKLFIDSTKRFQRRVSVFDNQGNELVSLTGDRDLLDLIDEAFKRAKIGLKDLALVEAKLEGESRVGVSIGAATANALNYALGLREINELEFPPPQPL